MTAPLVFMDTETTGVHRDRQVWEVAMIRRDDKGQMERQFFVAVDLSAADPFGLRVGRFYERHPRGVVLSQGGGDPRIVEAPLNRTTYMHPFDAACSVARWTHGAHIVGAVPNFDTESLSGLLVKHMLTPAWHYHLIDVENLAAGYLAHKRPHPGGIPLPWDSNEISRAVGVDPDQFERHTAMGDVRWAMAIYDAVMGGAS